MLVGYFLISPLYRFFQNRYFPYRNAKIDLTIFLLLIVFGYLYLIDFTPSFLRAFAFSLIAFIFLIFHIKILSFQTLLITIFTLIALSPQLLFHIGFWFSVCGVFYIFLYLHWFENSFNKIVHVLFLNAYVFLCINLIIHFFFPIDRKNGG